MAHLFCKLVLCFLCYKVACVFLDATSDRAKAHPVAVAFMVYYIVAFVFGANTIIAFLTIILKAAAILAVFGILAAVLTVSNEE